MFLLSLQGRGMDHHPDLIERWTAEWKVACRSFEEILSGHSSAAKITSAFVLAATVGFYSYAMLGHKGSIGSPYTLKGVFLSSSGLQVGANVMLAGVKVGTVSSISLDPSDFVSRVAFEINSEYRLPIDSSLGIGSSGFTAANALVITPGHAKQVLPAGSVIRHTIAMQSLEQTVSQYIFGKGGLD